MASHCVSTQTRPLRRREEYSSAGHYFLERRITSVYGYESFLSSVHKNEIYVWFLFELIF